MIGAISTVCAMTIPAGVNSQPSAPSGPLRDSSRYTTSPTTTGGNPMAAFSTTMTGWRQRPRAQVLLSLKRQANACGK